MQQARPSALSAAMVALELSMMRLASSLLPETSKLPERKPQTSQTGSAILATYPEFHAHQGVGGPSVWS